MNTEFEQEERYIVFKLADLHRYCSNFNISRIERVWQIIAEGRALEGKRPFSAVVVENDLPEYEPIWKAIEARMTGAQPAPNFADAYQGAMEEVAIWKKRALEAEDLNRKFVAEINGPTYMGEPAQPAASVPVEAIRKMLADAMAVAVSNGANSISMPDEYVEVAVWLRGISARPTASVPEGFSREELEAVAAGLDTYEKTVNVGNVTGEGDDHLESTTAYAARFIRAMLAVAPEAES